MQVVSISITELIYTARTLIQCLMHRFQQFVQWLAKNIYHSACPDVSRQILFGEV